MGSPLSKTLALAACAAIALVAPASSAPLFEPVFASGASTVKSDVVRVRDSARIIRRDRLDGDGGAWKKHRHHRKKLHERRHEARDFDGRSKLYRPRETPKYSYDAYGNFRVDDGERRERDHWDGWDRDWDGYSDGRDRQDWDKKRWKRPRILKNSFGEPSPGLKKVLTAAPD